MFRATILLSSLLLAATAHSGNDEAVAARRARRAALAKALGTEYALILGQPLTDVLTPRQEGDFIYLTGVRDPNAALLLAGAKARRLRTKAREVLLLRDDGDRYARFYGIVHRPGIQAETELGIEATRQVKGRAAALAKLVAELLPKKASVAIPAYRGPDHGLVREIRAVVTKHLAAARPDVKITAMRDRLRSLRAVKDAHELGLLTRAVAITHAAFRAALKDIRPGSSENAVDATLVATVRRAGAYPAYPFVVGAGIHATIPHYFRNESPLPAGDLVVIDCGAQFQRYAADITRTFPIDGTFTARQRECYDVVLKAQLAAIAMARPGVTFMQVHAAAKQIIAKAGLGPYFIHGTSHHIGLDVHDPGPVRLEPGMTLTIEPGVYIPEERIGIRIEDIVLITKEGCRVLGEPFPKTADEIEALLAKRAADPSRPR